MARNWARSSTRCFSAWKLGFLGCVLRHPYAYLLVNRLIYWSMATPCLVDDLPLKSFFIDVSHCQSVLARHARHAVQLCQGSSRPPSHRRRKPKGDRQSHCCPGPTMAVERTKLGVTENIRKWCFLEGKLVVLVSLWNSLLKLTDVICASWARPMNQTRFWRLALNEFAFN